MDPRFSPLCSVLTDTYPKNFPAELCRLPIQHFNSVLETYMFEKIFGRGLPITNSTLQQRFGAIHVQKNLRQSSADLQFNTSTGFWPIHILLPKLCQSADYQFNTSTLNFPHTGSIFLGESLKYVLDFLIFSLFNKSTENFPPLFKKFALLLVDRSKKHANSTDQQCFAPHMSKFFRKRICKINPTPPTPHMLTLSSLSP